MSKRQIDFEILRYDPDVNEKPQFQSFQVPCEQDWVVLDALNYIKDKLDRTLSYRWSCHMAVCGSCSMMINGEPALSCKTFLRDMPAKIRVEPLNNFPIERDLVVVMDDFMDKLKSVKPYLIPVEQKPLTEGVFLQSPAQLKKFKQFTLCINCTLCYAACPQYALNDGFIGPGALALAHRYNMDSRDVGRKARQDVVASNPGIWECSFVGACSEVCPHEVDPAAAIQQTKIASTGDYFLDMLLPGRKT